MKRFLIIFLVLLELSACSKKNEVNPDPLPDSETVKDSTGTKGQKETDVYRGVTDPYAGLDTNKYIDEPKFKGTYRGRLHLRNGNYYVEAISQVTFEGNNYLSSLGSGTFEIKAGKTISFTNDGIYDTSFDPWQILSRNYRYFAKGDSLIMTKDLSQRRPDAPPAFYQYRLKLIDND